MHSDPRNQSSVDADTSDAERDDEFAEEETVVLTESDLSETDNVGDVSVEINVEELVAKVEAEQDSDAARKKEIRRKLEELAEEQSLEDTYAVDFDD